MLFIGSHVSFKNDSQLVGSIKEALSYDANSFMFYTGAPQNTARSPINEELTKEFHKICIENDIDINNVVCHAPYIINLANSLDQSKYEFAYHFLRNEIDRCLKLGVKKLVLHPGSSLTIPKEKAILNIVEALNKVLKEDDDIFILLETMAGKGTEVGKTLEEISSIIDGVNLKDKVGVCLDTCHLNDAGYDISKFDDYLLLFNKMIGLDKIGCVHINDSKNELNAHKDRHENIGFGTIGFDNLMHVIYHEALSGVPKILETPYVEKMYPPYKLEIASIKNKQKNENLYEDVIKLYK